MKMQYQDIILDKLKQVEELNSTILQKQLGLTYQALYPQLVSLTADNYICLQPLKINKLILTKQGKKYALQGTPQAKIYELASVEGTSKQIIQKQLGEGFKFGFGNAKSKNIVDLKDNKIFRIKEEFVDMDQKMLINIGEGIQFPQKKELARIKKRKLVEQKQQTYFIIKKGVNYKQKKVQFHTQITSSMISNGSWEDYSFKQFNSQAKGLQIQNGNLHILLKTRQQFKSILIQMGFQQMKTDRYVQSSFWNFDALFQPQAHPARDAHDTFFVSHPKQAKIQDKPYFQEVKKIHQKGGYGSKGYDYQWQEKQAKKNILRTHTTAVSSNVLRSIASQVPFRSRKFFSIDRVFRNQTLDQTHLAQFHQVQGFVIDRNLGLNHLIGVLTEFYKRIGIQKIQLKPTYNPYTQPSMEIFGYHPILKKRVQMGNSGIFRPEMLRPMGFPEDVSVIAWGLGLERPTMIQYGFHNIKQLFGPGVSIKKIKESPIYCL